MLAQQLYAVMTDPERGQCVPALDAEQGGGLVLDPTVQQAKGALRAAFRRASEDQATLFLVYVGHGEAIRDDFYLPSNAALPPRSDTAVHLVQLLLEEYNEYSQVDGLVLLLDACFAGAAATGAASRWIHALQGQMRFQLLTATGLNPAYNGCFTRSLATLIREGLADAYSGHLQAHHRPGPSSSAARASSPSCCSACAAVTPACGSPATGRFLTTWKYGGKRMSPGRQQFPANGRNHRSRSSGSVCWSGNRSGSACGTCGDPASPAPPAPGVGQGAHRRRSEDCPCPLLSWPVDYEESGWLSSGPWPIRVFNAGRLKPKAIPW
jgi:hypothetical protein